MSLELVRTRRRLGRCRTTLVELAPELVIFEESTWAGSSFDRRSKKFARVPKQSATGENHGQAVPRATLQIHGGFHPPPPGNSAVQGYMRQNFPRAGPPDVPNLTAPPRQCPCTSTSAAASGRRGARPQLQQRHRSRRRGARARRHGAQCASPAASLEPRRPSDERCLVGRC